MEMIRSNDVPIKEGTIVEVYVPVETPAKRPRSIGDSPFDGMWKDLKKWLKASNTSTGFSANCTAVSGPAQSRICRL